VAAIAGARAAAAAPAPSSASEDPYPRLCLPFTESSIVGAVDRRRQRRRRPRRRLKERRHRWREMGPFPSGDDPVFVRRPAACLASDDAFKQELTLRCVCTRDASRISPWVEASSSIIESFRRHGRWSSSRAFGVGRTHRYCTAPSWFDDAAASMGWGRPFEHVRTAFG
jgi:hypothetical protein